MYNQEEKAIKFVIQAFSGKKRMKEDIDLSFHSISVGFILKNNGCDTEIVITGLLHDIIEDTDYSYNDLKELFGKKIADNVLIVSENKGITNWKERKKIYIEKIAIQNSEIVLVELADKLHNLLSNYDLFINHGKDIFITKNASYEEHKWYYMEFKKIFEEKLANNELLDRYIKLTNLYFM